MPPRRTASFSGMAKARDIPLSPWEPYAATAARTVRVRTDELFAASEGVLDTDDIERVHDMRVASRRLRAVLEVFAPCFPRAEYKAVLTDVKRLADALGRRRDPDVHIDSMQAFASEALATQRPGVRAMVDRLRERQAEGNGILERELERAAAEDLRGRLHALAAHAGEASP